MTRKDYVLLAAAFNRSKPRANEIRLAGWVAALESVTDALSIDNPRFDRKRFYDAAEFGIQGVE